ncbi:HutR like protein, partial [Vibrio cholerae]
WSNTTRIEREEAWTWDAINGEIYAYSIHAHEMGLLLVADE